MILTVTEEKSQDSLEDNNQNCRENEGNELAAPSISYSISKGWYIPLFRLISTTHSLNLK